MFSNTYSQRPARIDELLSRLLLGSVAALVLVGAAGWSDESGATGAVQMALNTATTTVAMSAEPPVLLSQADVEPR